jgi:FMN phosphatase YigB (HAD superfamily)
MRQKIYERFSEQLGVPLQRAITIFENEWKNLGVGTEIFKKYGIEPILLLNAINSVDKKRFLKRDPKLLNMFKKNLKKFNHFILTNNTKKDILNTLKILGVPKNIFALIIAFDNVAYPKPHPEPFMRVLEFTNDPPEMHVVVGDNDKMDIVPSKNLGMKAIMVWKESKIADRSVKSIYDVPKVLFT